MTMPRVHALRWLAVCWLALQLGACGSGSPGVAPTSTGPDSTASATNYGEAVPSASPAATPAGKDGKERNSGTPSASVPETDVGTSASPERSRPPAAVASSFDAERPALGSIALGADETAVAGAYGTPASRYALPDGPQRIEMREYEGLTVGFDANGKVVYVEITSERTETGIRGLSVGTGAKDAAKALGLSSPTDSNVIAARVNGGLLKLDLDPGSRDVLSIKLIGDADPAS